MYQIVRLEQWPTSLMSSLVDKDRTRPWVKRCHGVINHSSLMIVVRVDRIG